jgi:hypothetical protein
MYLFPRLGTPHPADRPSDTIIVGTHGLAVIDRNQPGTAESITLRHLSALRPQLA